MSKRQTIDKKYVKIDTGKNADWQRRICNNPDLFKRWEKLNLTRENAKYDNPGSLEKNIGAKYEKIVFFRTPKSD